QPAGGGAEGDEHGCEAGDEQEGGHDHPAHVSALALLQLGDAEPRHERQVAGHEGKDARREEREHPATEGTDQAGVADPGQSEHYCPRKVGGRRSRKAAMPSTRSSLDHARAKAASKSSFEASLRASLCPAMESGASVEI